MARRGRPAKIQAEPLNPCHAEPNSQTEKETLVNIQDVNSVGITSFDTKVEKKRRKKENFKTLSVRRSGRLNSPTPVNSIEPIFEEIIIPDYDKEEAVNVENNLPEGTPDAPATQPSPVETTGAANLNYRSMYIDSQKKVRTLMKKNRQLKRSLEFAHGKIEVYAEMTPILSSLSKANEILCNRPWGIKRLRT